MQSIKVACRLVNANAEPMQVITTSAPPHTPLNRRVPIRELMLLRQQAKEIHPPRFHHGLVTTGLAVRAAPLLARPKMRVISGGGVADQVPGAVRLQEQGDVPLGAGARAALGLRGVLMAGEGQRRGCVPVGRQ